MDDKLLNDCLDRAIEKTNYMQSFENNRITTILSGAAHGGTTLLKHIFYSFILNGKIVFYLDFKNKNIHIANQLGRQMEVYLSTSFHIKDAFCNIILPGLIKCIKIPGTNISAGSILCSLKKLCKTGKIHIDDKFEELFNLCVFLMQNESRFNQNIVYIIIDNASEDLESNEDYLLKIASIPTVHMMLLCNNNRIIRFVDIAVRNFNCSKKQFTLSLPPNELIKLICTEVYNLDPSQCVHLYGKNYGIYDICNTLYMAKNANLTIEEKSICNLIHFFNGKISENLMRKFLQQETNLTLRNELLDKLIQDRVVLIDEESHLICDSQYNLPFQASVYEYSIMTFMQEHLSELSLDELKFLHNNTSVINLKSRISLLIIELSVNNGREDCLHYATFVDEIQNERELLLILYCFYKLGLYDEGIKRIKQYNKTFNVTNNSKFLNALFLERKYDRQALKIIKELLLNTKTSLDAKCYFATAYVSCIINIGSKKLLNEFFDISSPIYFEKFKNCDGYVYLLNALGNHYKNDELLLLAHQMFMSDPICYDRAIANLIAYYDETNEPDKCNQLLNTTQSPIFSTESAFYFNNKALHDLRYQQDDINSVLSILKLLEFKNRSEAATLFSKINYCTALIFQGDYKKGIKKLIGLESLIKKFPSKPLLDNYYYNLYLAYKCFSCDEIWNGLIPSEPTEENRNFSKYCKLLTCQTYDINSYKKHVKFCYLYERKFNIISILETRFYN